MATHAHLSVGRGVRLELSDLVAVARGGAPLSLGEKARSAMKRSERLLASYINDRLPVYGATTQFGNQAHLLDPHLKSDKGDDRYFESIRARQKNLVQSHDLGLGEELPEEVTRAAMVLRAQCLSQGYAGIRPEVIDRLLELLNNKIHPIIRRYGSIGASGDLIPLSSIAATLIGLPRDVVAFGKRMKAPAALKKAKMKPLVLEGREGLALINGTSFSTAMAALAFADLERIFFQMLASIAISLETLQVMDSGYNPIVHAVKGQRGQQEVNAWLLSFWKGSTLIRHLESSRREMLEYDGHGDVQQDSKSMQDYYSLRSVAQGFGPFYENMATAKAWIEREMNSVNDNPVTDADTGQVLHSANFMGYYITEAADLMKMDIAQASTWIHALLANFVHARKNFGLPTNLMNQPDIHNGFRPIQLLAASITIQNRKLAQSQQAYMLPTEGDNQDINSLSKHAAFDFRESVANLERLTAILFMAAMQALDLRGAKKASDRAQKAHTAFRKHVRFLDADRMAHTDLEATIQFLRTATL